MTETRKWTARAWAVLCVALFGLSACGGGGADGPFARVGSGGTGSFANGPVTAQGSIVVGGVHFDHERAQVTNAEGAPLLYTDIKLGMVVELDASSVGGVNGQPRAEALHIQVMNALVGVVDAVDAGADTVTVMGQTVKVTPATHYDDALPLKLQGLAPGDVVEVHGFHDATADVFMATRIARKDAAAVTHFVVRGVIRDLDLANRRCRIGQQLIDYAWPAGATADAALANGSVATARLLKTPVYPGDGGSPAIWGASDMTLAKPTAANLDDAYLDGLVTDKDPVQVGRFSVNGIKVDARQPLCTVCATLAVGQHVKVRGRLGQGEVTASEVQRLAD